MNTGLQREISILSEARGCLEAKRTRTARRRFTDDEDLLVPGIDPFLIDSELKIAPSKAVRRMLDKTQVLTNPRNLHIRKRITHAGEVTSAASFIAALLGLNVELARAIALGHDIGHPPFGHDGEAFLNTLVPNRAFKHEIMGVVIAQHIERGGKGLNLTHEVLSGFVRDAWPKVVGEKIPPMSEEAKVVMWADRFAYVTGDYNDMERIGYQKRAELDELMQSFGMNQRERVNKLITALVGESARMGGVAFYGSQMAEAFCRAKNLMYEAYPLLNASNADSILSKIYEFLQKILKGQGVDPALAFALMTDNDVMFLASQPILDYSCFAQVTVAELLPHLANREIKWWDPDLKW